jgi:uncharacterized protein (DUF58 family)
VRPAAGLIVLSAVLFALGAAQGWSLLYGLAYSLGLTILLSFLWSWFSVRALYIRPRPRLLRAQVGTFLEERSVVENLNWLPRPWLELLDASDHPEHTLSQVLSLGPLERRSRVVRTLCCQRGEYRLGPIWASGADPFGLFRRERMLSTESRLIVLPATVELPAFGRLPGELPGGSLQGERVHFTTPNVASVREYQPADSFNRVHWPSTARHGRLMVKEFERDPFADLWLVLDLDRSVQAGSGPDSTEEHSITIAASLARHFLLRDRAVGVLTQGQELPVDRGPRQLLRSLEFLAAVRTARRQSLEELLIAVEKRFGRRDNLVVITPSSIGPWLAVVSDLAARGVYSSLVLLDAVTFSADARAPAVRAPLAGTNLAIYSVRKDDDLAKALAQPSRFAG